MKTKFLIAWLWISFACSVSAQTYDSISRATNIVGTDLMAVQTNSAGAAGQKFLRTITVSNLWRSFTNLYGAAGGGGGGSATNAVSTVKSNGITIATGATSLDFVTGTNTVIRATNASGAVSIQINAPGNTVNGLTNYDTRDIQFTKPVLAPNVLYSNLVYVDATNASGIINGATLTNAFKNAAQGSLIVVGPGVYYTPNLPESPCVTMIRDNVSSYWMPGARWFVGTAGVGGINLLWDDDSGKRTNCNVYGWGDFWATNGGIYHNANGSKMFIQAQSMVHTNCLGDASGSVFVFDHADSDLEFDIGFLASYNYDIMHPVTPARLVGRVRAETETRGDLIEGDADTTDGSIDIQFFGTVRQTALAQSTIFQLPGGARVRFWGDIILNTGGGALASSPNSAKHAYVEGGHFKYNASSVNSPIGAYDVGAKTALWIRNSTFTCPNNVDFAHITNLTGYPLTLENVTINNGSGSTNWVRAYATPVSVRVIGNLGLNPYKPIGSGVTLLGTNWSPALHNQGTLTNGGAMTIGGASTFLNQVAVFGPVDVQGSDLTVTGGGIVADNAFINAIGPSKLVRTDGSQLLGEVTIGSNIAWDGTTLSASSNIVTIASGSATLGSAIVTNSITAATMVPTSTAFFPSGASLINSNTGFRRRVALWNSTQALDASPNVDDAELEQLDGVSLIATVQQQFNDGVTSRTALTNYAAGVSNYASTKQHGTLILTNLSGTGAITNLFSATLSNATIKPLVIGAGNTAGATNQTGGIRGLEAGANITLGDNGSNVTITATGGAATSNYTTLAAGSITANLVILTNGLRYNASNLAFAGTNLVADGSSASYFTNGIASSGLTNIVFTNLLDGQTLTADIWVTNGTTVQICTAPGIVAPAQWYQDGSVVSVNSNGFSRVKFSRFGGWTNIAILTPIMELTANGNIVYVTNFANRTILATLAPTLTNIAGTGAITNLFSPTLSNATIKPLVVGIGAAAGATNTSGQVRGLAAGSNITLSENGSNIVINAAGASASLFSAGNTNATDLAIVHEGTNTTGGIKTIRAGSNITITESGGTNLVIASTGGGGSNYVTLSSGSITLTNQLLQLATNLNVQGTNLVANGTVSSYFTNAIAQSGLTNIVVTNLLDGQIVTIDLWVTNGTPVRIGPAPEVAFPASWYQDGFGPAINTNGFSRVRVSRYGEWTNITVNTPGMTLAANGNVAYVTNFATREILVTLHPALTNIVGTGAVTNENSSALQINSGTLTLTPGLLSNMVFTGLSTPYFYIKTNDVDIAYPNTTNLNIKGTFLIVSNDAIGVASLHQNRRIEVDTVTNVANVNWQVCTPTVLQTNIVLSFNTNRYMICGMTNLVLTNIVESFQNFSTGSGGYDASLYCFTTNNNMNIVWPAYGAQHGYFFRTNINNPVLSWAAVTNGKSAVISFTCLGTNIYGSITEWP